MPTLENVYKKTQKAFKIILFSDLPVRHGRAPRRVAPEQRDDGGPQPGPGGGDDAAGVWRALREVHRAGQDKERRGKCPRVEEAGGGRAGGRRLGQGCVVSFEEKEIGCLGTPHRGKGKVFLQISITTSHYRTAAKNSLASFPIIDVPRHLHFWLHPLLGQVRLRNPGGAVDPVRTGGGGRGRKRRGPVREPRRRARLLHGEV